MTDKISEIFELIRNGKGFPANLRLYLVSENQQLFINKGNVHRAFYSNVSATHLAEKREPIIEIFSRFEFVIDEIIRLHVIGFRSTKEKNLLDLMDVLGAMRKVEFLYKWKLIPNNLKNSLKELFKVRNGVAHDIGLYSVLYKKAPVFKLVDKTNFNNFKTDLEKAWKKLQDIYINEEKKIDWDLFITELRAFQNSISQK